MAINHFVPEGKTLYVSSGRYTFKGPCQVNMSGGMVLPDTYTDGTSTKETIIEEIENVHTCAENEVLEEEIIDVEDSIDGSI